MAAIESPVERRGKGEITVVGPDQAFFVEVSYQSGEKAVVGAERPLSFYKIRGYEGQEPEVMGLRPGIEVDIDFTHNDIINSASFPFEDQSPQGVRRVLRDKVRSFHQKRRDLTHFLWKFTPLH